MEEAVVGIQEGDELLHVGIAQSRASVIDIGLYLAKALSAPRAKRLLL